MIGLDAEGTRDLVSDSESGLLLRLPAPNASNPGAAPYTWPTVCRSHTSPVFLQCADTYASLLARVATDHALRRSLGDTAARGASVGRSWWDAMEMCVDGYREAIRLARARRQSPALSAQTDTPARSPSQLSPGSKRFSSTVNRVVSRRLAHRGRWASEGKPDESGAHRAECEVESLWHLSESLVDLGSCASSDRPQKPCARCSWRLPCSTPSTRGTQAPSSVLSRPAGHTPDACLPLNLPIVASCSCRCSSYACPVALREEHVRLRSVISDDALTRGTAGSAELMFPAAPTSTREDRQHVIACTLSYTFSPRLRV